MVTSYQILPVKYLILHNAKSINIEVCYLKHVFYICENSLLQNLKSFGAVVSILEQFE